jgi:hypothetical protein
VGFGGGEFELCSIGTVVGDDLGLLPFLDKDIIIIVIVLVLIALDSVGFMLFAAESVDDIDEFDKKEEPFEDDCGSGSEAPLSL